MSKYSREQLAEMKVAELKSICKENGIKHYNGKNRYTKQQMIEAIIVAFPEEEQQEEQKEEQQVEETVKKLEDNPKVKESKCNEEEVKNTEDAESKRKAYVENVAIGTIVAFRTPDGKVKSAKVINKFSISNYKRLKLETKYGAIYIIKYEDVIWVKTGKRFPRGVYNLLKGIETIEHK